MQISNLAARETTESAKKLKTVAMSPLGYQTALNDIFAEFNLDDIDYSVIPFAYDGTSWLAATANSGIRIGSLNNEYTPWTTMLYVMRDNPLFMFDEMRESHIDSIDYQMHVHLLNLFMRKLKDAKENDRRRFEEDDIYACASRWLTITEGADWSDGSVFNGTDLVNGFKAENRTISINKSKNLLEDLSSRLDGAFFCDLDPFVHATMMLQHEDGIYSHEETLWIITPEPNDVEKASRMISQFGPILYERGAKFIFILPLEAQDSFLPLTRKVDGITELLPGILHSNFVYGRGSHYQLVTNLEPL